MTLPGPSTIDSAVRQHDDIRNLRDRRDWLIDMHRPHKTRVDTVTNVATGNWHVEWPDLSQTPEAPTVANQVELGIGHWAAIFGAVLPSVKVPVNKTADRRTEKAAVRKRERRVKELWESSNMSELCSLWGADYSGAGTAMLGAWVNFEEPDPAKRNPYAIRFDPRHTYPLKDENGNITELLVARKISKAEVSARWPEWAGVFSKADDEQIEEWFWYTKNRVTYQIVDVSAAGKKADRNLTLVDEEWELGFVPAWEIVLPSFDGQRRGIFDQALHLLRVMQRLMLMTILSTEEHAFPATASYDVINPEDYGPGADLRYRSADGKIDRLGPATHFDVKDLVARLGDEASKQALYPQQLSGEPGASIVSARGIGASMGALDARLAVAHKQFEVGLGKMSGFLLAMDETFCDGDKTIVGDLRDMSDAESYRPSKDVNGAWVVNCTYGVGAGSDPSNAEMRVNMNFANGFLSRESARAQLPFLEDPEAEPVKQFREAMQDSIVQGIMQMSAQGDPSLAAKALELLESDDLDFDQVMRDLVEAIQAPPEAPPGGDPAAAAVQGAESLARGGIPGQAADAPPGGAGGLGLPPLGDILGQDARLVS
jgi:hypothetical protein